VLLADTGTPGPLLSSTNLRIKIENQLARGGSAHCTRDGEAWRWKKTSGRNGIETLTRDEEIGQDPGADFRDTEATPKKISDQKRAQELKTGKRDPRTGDA
jgi:hypothetical protein